jgi:curved DNA-binding protein CbpA
MKDYYYILGVNRNANIDEIKKAFRKLSLKFHPDKNENDPFFTERFKEINEAYETLSDQDKRSKYNYNLSSFINQNTKIPEIIFFKSDKNLISMGEIIILSWKTINADRVHLTSFGNVDFSGTKRIKALDTDKINLSFILTAENTFTGQKVSSKHIIRIIQKENEEKKQKENTKRMIEEKRIFGINHLTFINAILKPILLFGTIAILVYLLIKFLQNN